MEASSGWTASGAQTRCEAVTSRPRRLPLCATCPCFLEHVPAVCVCCDVMFAAWAAPTCLQVVQVPLGTSVWRLVQLRGPGAVDTPHGVTPTPAAAAAAAAQHSTHYQHSSQQNEGSAAAGTPFSRQQHAQQDTASSAVPQQHRRRLFADDRLEAANTSSSNSAAQGDGSGAGAPDGSPTSSTCSSDASSSTISDAGHEQEQEHELNTGQRAAEALYEDLLSCRVALSNRQKLQLLHCGSLDDQAAAAAMLDWQDDSSEAEEGEGTGSDGDSASEQDDDDDDDVEGFDGAAGSWQGQQQWSRAGSGARGLGEWGDAEERHFTKQQVSTNTVVQDVCAHLSLMCCSTHRLFALGPALPTTSVSAGSSGRPSLCKHRLQYGSAPAAVFFLWPASPHLCSRCSSLPPRCVLGAALPAGVVHPVSTG